MLIAALFFAALRAKLVSGTGATDSLEVPVVQLELHSGLVLASGPFVLSFLLLIVLGALRAFTTAREKLALGTGFDWKAEAVDTYPNAIDLALYTTETSPKPLARIAYFGYPIFLTAVLVEAAWIWRDLLSAQLGLPARHLFAMLAAPLWLAALWQVIFMWAGRLAKIFSSAKGDA